MSQINRPEASSPAALKRMQSQRQAGTQPELVLQGYLRERGIEFDTNLRFLAGLTRTADIVVESARVALFVDGCYWHGCPQHGSTPAANADFWRAKIAANAERDRDTDLRAQAAGWAVVRVWEHQSAAEVIEGIVGLVFARSRQPHRLRS